MPTQLEVANEGHAPGRVRSRTKGHGIAAECMSSIKKAFTILFGVFAEKQSFLNVAYLLAGFACGLIDLILFSVIAGLVLGLVAVPVWVTGSFSLDWTAAAKTIAVGVGGVLVIPASMLLWFFPAVLEQKLAAWLLNVRFSVRAFWTVGASLPAAAARYIVSGVAWRRFLFGVIRIPLGFVSFVAVMVSLPAAVALLSMPAAYLAGYQDLIVGRWRIDSFLESLAVFLGALFLMPLLLHALNLLSRLSGGLARLCLQD